MVPMCLSLHSVTLYASTTKSYWKVFTPWKLYLIFLRITRGIPHENHRKGTFRGDGYYSNIYSVSTDTRAKQCRAPAFHRARPRTGQDRSLGRKDHEGRASHVQNQMGRADRQIYAQNQMGHVGPVPHRTSREASNLPSSLPQGNHQGVC